MVGIPSDGLSNFIDLSHDSSKITHHDCEIIGPLLDTPQDKVIKTSNKLCGRCFSEAPGSHCGLLSGKGLQSKRSIIVSSDSC